MPARAGSACAGRSSPATASRSSPYVLVSGQATVRASFFPQSFPSNTVVGVELSNEQAAKAAALIFVRAHLLGPGSDAIGVELHERVYGVIATAVVAPNAGAFLASNQRVELEIELVPEPGGEAVRPVPRSRLCPNAGCAPDVPFLEVPRGPGVWSGAGLLPADEALAVFFFGQGSSGFSVDLREWSAAASFHDDFVAPGFGRTLPYSTECAETEQVGGALTVTVPAQDCQGHLGVGAILPGAPRVQARFAFAMPSRCGTSVGVGLAGNGDPFPEDGLLLLLAREPLPGIGSDVLFAALAAEAEGDDPELFVPIAVHVLAADAGAMAVPADGEIEMRVTTTPGGSGLLDPLGEVRLCSTSPCPPESEVPFDALAPFAFPPGYDSPCPDHGEEPVAADGGALRDEPVGAVLYLAPEPDAGLLAAGACGALAAVSAPRRQGARR